MDKVEKQSFYELVPEDLCCKCNPEVFDFHDTGELSYRPLIIGQERAVDALQFGLDIGSPGFNVFVMGIAGTGRHSILKRILKDIATQAETPDDWVYVNHFVTPGAPRAISLPPGMGVQFRADMERFNAELIERLQHVFETDQYAEARERLEQDLRSAELSELTTVEQLAQEQGFALVRSPSGLYLAPMQEGEILTPEMFSQLSVEIRTELDQIHDDLQDLLNGALRRFRERERQTQAEIEHLDREVAGFTIEPLLRDLVEKYAGQAEIQIYLNEVRKDVIENVTAFRGEGDSDTEEEGGSLLSIPVNQRYRVNLLVDNSHTQGSPVIFEETPSYDRLFGRIEYDMRYGMTVTDYTLIRAGALHRANGGYLVLDAETLLETPYVWSGLKRALFSGEIRIESPDGQQLVRTVTPEPEPIPLQVKIILHGLPSTYYALYDYDEEFAKHFKVQVDFRAEMARTLESEQAYAHFIRALSEEEHLLPFESLTVARVVEFGAWLCEHQERLSTQFGQVADLVREASYWARKSQRVIVQQDDVLRALRQRKQRANLTEELARREILEEHILVTTEGCAIGEVNGLTVIALGGYSFGVPCRITARAYVGRGNVMDIYREIELGGPIHSKGVLTLIGYFGGHYGTRHSLSMEASLSFEQMYSEIDGDSASSAELYALISALSGFPLRQDLAVTGAVDQVGRVLPIGGVNEKIEGIFEICRARGLTGKQGVIIPRRNLKNLMLVEDVVAAVRAGKFHIYAIDTIDAGLELLTGRPAGTRGPDGTFPSDSVHAAVEARLQSFTELVREEKATSD
ncbi:MAG: AAA family ATPase [Anaerolineae bacterium]|nr:AAA family ATPase [Anaerolineae bacterium]